MAKRKQISKKKAFEILQSSFPNAPIYDLNLCEVKYDDNLNVVFESYSFRWLIKKVYNLKEVKKKK
jgi:hypothetical protein